MGLTIPMAAVGSTPYLDGLSDRSYEAQGKSLYLTLPPYGRIWLKGKP